MNINHSRIILVFLALLIFSISTVGQTKDANLIGVLTTEFTYQGKLTDTGANANGNYDFEFKLMDGNGNVLGTLQKLNVAVANGIFTVRLDYGATPFTSLSDKFLEIGVKPVGNAAYTTLSPRQPVTATPIAINSSFAINANFANLAFDSTKLGGTDANQYVLTTDSRLNPNNYIQNSTNEQTAGFIITGTGSAEILNARTEYRLLGFRFIHATGINNVFLGYSTGANLISGENNSFVGAASGFGNTTGSDNSFFGMNAGFQNTSGLQNSFFGMKAGRANQTGGGNSFFGALAGTSANGGNGNSFFGAEAGRNMTTGSDNAIFGRSAGFSLVNGQDNAYFGSYSGYLGFTVSNNAFFGAYSGNGNSGSNNSFFGSSAGFKNGGNGNSFFGSDAGKFNTSGLYNSFFGINSGNRNTVGQFNAFYGANSGFSNLQGGNNTFLGNEAGISNTSGSNNTYVGNRAGAVMTTGNNNIFIGSDAGEFNSPTASNNIVIGNNSSVSANATNSIVIGSGNFTNSSNEVVIGGSQQNVFIPGKLKIGIFGSPGTAHLCSGPNNEISLCSSSIRYKTDVQDFTSGLELIRRLRPVTFRWKQNNQQDLGFVAEEVNAIEPLLTTYNDNGEVEGVKYDRVSTALVNAVNEQQTEIESQADQIKSQQTRIENQERQLKLQQQQIDALQKLVCAANPQAAVCREKESEK